MDDSNQQMNDNASDSRHGTGSRDGRLVLHRKWRSGDFEEIVGQEHVVRTLKNALSRGRIAPAYLFSGPRGTGKTSTARILAKALNCPNLKDGEPCDKCRVCRDISNGSFLDVIEMDAASHTQVDKIREFIVEKVNFRPIEGDRKVYIIDEVHKLSAYSFDALLKTIEEPPPFVVFILATTEPEKLPPTILSRCQRYDFKRISVKDIISRLRYVCEQENFCIEDGALNLIAQASDGALRDALVILEQAVSFTEGCVTAGEIVSMLGMTHYDILFTFTDIIFNKDTRAGFQFIDDIYGKGKDLHRFTQDLLEHFRRMLIIRMVRDAEVILQISDDLYTRLSGTAFNFKPNHILHIITELMNLRQNMKEVGMERLLWETTVVKLTRWEISPSLDGLNRRIERVEQALSGNLPEGQPAPVRQAAPPVKEVLFKPPPFIREPEREVKKEVNQEIKREIFVKPAEILEDKPAEKSSEPVRENMLSVGERISPPATPGMNDASLWRQLLKEATRENIMVAPILKEEGAGRLTGNKYVLRINVNKTFNKVILENNRRYIEEVLSRLTDKRINLVIESKDSKDDIFEEKEKPHNEFVQEVIDLFGASPVDKPL